MINPLLFDLKLSVEFENDNCGIEAIYGVDDNQCERILKTGEIVTLNTFFIEKLILELIMLIKLK